MRLQAMEALRGEVEELCDQLLLMMKVVSYEYE